MPKGIPKVAPEIREQIIKRIKEEGVSVQQAAQDHGLSTKTVYNWLAKGITAPPGILEVAKLKRENQALLEMIGRLTVDLTAAKKKENGG